MTTMCECARHYCAKTGTNFSICSACLREPYCSSSCQKDDWKIHKKVCKTLKKMSHQLQPFNDVQLLCEEIYEENDKKKQPDVRVLVHLISYAEFQFGDRAPGNKVYRERYGERIDNWEIEIGLLYPLYNNMINIYVRDDSLSKVATSNLSLPYSEKMLDLIRPWSTFLDSNSANRTNISNEDQNHIMMLLSQTECNMAAIYRIKTEFNLAENFIERALKNARLYKGNEEQKTNLLCSALGGYCDLRKSQDKYADALSLAEENYNLLAMAYNPVHPRVQKAASKMIECLIHKGDLDKAQLFAEVMLGTLKDPANEVNQQSEELANGYYDLANVLCTLKGDLVKAEMLVRESLHIRSGLFDKDHPTIAISSDLLARILQKQGKVDCAAENLLLDALASDIEHYGRDGEKTGAGNFNLGNFYFHAAKTQQTSGARKDQLLLSESSYTEALRIYRKTLGPCNPRAIQTEKTLADIIRLLSQI